MSNILAHYYVDPTHNPRAIFRTRVAVEFNELPSPGRLVIIGRHQMKMNDTLLGPGVYFIKEVRPNKEHPDPIYDYTVYGSWTEMQPCSMIIAEPVLITSQVDRNIDFYISTSINNEGIMVSRVAMIDTSTGEVIREIIHE